MSNTIPLPFIDVDPISGLPVKTSLEPGGHMLFEGSDGKAYRIETEAFYQLLHKIAVPISPSDPGPFIANTWYKPNVYSSTPGTNYPNAGNLKAIEGYDTLFFYNGTSWTKMANKLPSAKIDTWIATAYGVEKQVFYNGKIYEANSDVLSTDVPGISPKWTVKVKSFDEAEFNRETKKYIEYSLISRDLSAVNMPNVISSGAGDSIFTTILTTDKKLTKLRIKVATAGVGKFTAKRGSSLLVIAEGVALVVGWNDVLVNFDGLQGDYIGYSTKDSTANLYFGDNTGGNYYNINGQAFNGNIAVEVYESTSTVNSFEDLAKANLTGGDADIFGVNAFTVMSKVAKPNIRQIDYGVVSSFNSPLDLDLLGNNKLKVSSSSIVGDFLYNDYNYSFGFTVSFPNKYTTSKNVATFNLGSYTLNIIAGGVGIAANIGSQSNAITYEYGNKNVNFVLVANAYYTVLYVDGTPIGFKNVGKIASQFNFSLNTQDNKSFQNIVMWNRSISLERANQWTLDKNPFLLVGIKDKLFPNKGIQLSNHLLQGNQYFEIPAEQSIIKFKGKYYMYYTVGKGTSMTIIESGVGVAVSNRPDGGFMMYTDDAVIGGNRNKAGVNRAMGSWAGVVADTVYVFAAMDYNTPSSGGKIFKSSNGLDFTLVGNFIPTGIPYLANISIYPEKQSNGYYYGIVEGKEAGSWKSYLVRSLNFENGWEMVQKLSSLEISPGLMYGGPELLKTANGDRWIVFYHAAYEPSSPSLNSPTSLFYAECFDIGAPINWVNKRRVLDINDEIDFYNAYNCDQVATPQILEDNGKTYLSYVLAQNEPTLHCQIRMFKLDMTKEELVGLVPLEYDKNPMSISLGSKFSNSSAAKLIPDLPLFTKIIASGTSITNGVGSDGATGIDASKTWRNILQTTLTNVTGRTVTVVNGGVNGQNTSSMKTNLPALLTGNSGQVVILEGAINDAQTSGVGIPVSATISNLSSMIDSVIASGNVPVLTTPMPLNLEVPEVAAAYTNQKRSDLAYAVRMLAKNKNVRLIDLDKLANNDTTLLVDGLHPNPKGYLFMANAISSEII